MKAPDDWMTAVSTIPVKKLKKRLSPRVVMMLLNQSVSANEPNDILISSRPKNKKPIPVIILPDSFHFLLLISITTNAPTKINGRHTTDTTSSEMIYARAVVPIWAPIIIGRACFKSNSPALIRPTTITVVALDD